MRTHAPTRLNEFVWRLCGGQTSATAVLSVSRAASPNDPSRGRSRVLPMRFHVKRGRLLSAVIRESSAARVDDQIGPLCRPGVRLLGEPGPAQVAEGGLRPGWCVPDAIRISRRRQIRGAEAASSRTDRSAAGSKLRCVTQARTPNCCTRSWRRDSMVSPDHGRPNEAAALHHHPGRVRESGDLIRSAIRPVGGGASASLRARAFLAPADSSRLLTPPRQRAPRSRGASPPSRQLSVEGPRHGGASHPGLDRQLGLQRAEGQCAAAPRARFT